MTGDSTMRVLLIDNDALFHTLLGDTLGAEGFAVTQVWQSDAARHLLLAETYQLLVIYTEIIGAVELLVDLRQNTMTRDLPVICQLTTAAPDYHAFLQRYPPVTLFVRPFELADFVLAAWHLIDG